MGLSTPNSWRRYNTKLKICSALTGSLYSRKVLCHLRFRNFAYQLGDARGLEHRLSYYPDASYYKVTSPDGSTSILSVNNDGNLSNYQDAEGKRTNIGYNSLGYLNSMTLPTGGQIEIDYSQNQDGIPACNTSSCTLSTATYLPVVIAVKRYLNAGSVPQVINYDYSTSKQTNFSGFPNYGLNNANHKDLTLEDGDNTYTYKSIQQSGANGIYQQDVTTYNHLHLPIEVKHYYKDPATNNWVLQSADKSYYEGLNASAKSASDAFNDQENAYDFPSYQQLQSSGNYAKVRNHFSYFVDKGNTRTSFLHSEYNDYGLPTLQVRYDQSKGSYQLKDKTAYYYSYDKDASKGEILIIHYDPLLSNAQQYQYHLTQSDQYGNKVYEETGYSNDISGSQLTAERITRESFYNVGESKELNINDNFPTLVKSEISQWATKDHSGIQSTEVDYSYSYNQEDKTLTTTTTSQADDRRISSIQTTDYRNGSILSQSEPFDADEKPTTSSLNQYDILGRLTKSIDNAGNEVDHFYGFGNVDEDNYVESCTNPLHLSTQGDIEASGVCQKQVFDGLGNPWKSYTNIGGYTDGVHWQLLNEIIYDAALRKISEINYSQHFDGQAEAADQDAITTTYEYNPKGEMVATRQYFGIKRSNLYDDTSSQLVNKNTQESDQINQVIASAYNNQLMRKSYFTDNGDITRSDAYTSNYNKSLTSNNITLSALGQTLAQQSTLNVNDQTQLLFSATNQYDLLNKLTDHMVNFYQEGQLKVNVTSHQEYDLLGNLLSKQVMVGKYQATSELSSFNNFGQLTTLKNNNNQIKTYTYDPKGQVAQTTDYAGVMTEYHYNVQDSLTDKTIHGKHTINYHYDYYAPDSAEGYQVSDVIKAVDGEVSSHIHYEYSNVQQGNQLTAITYCDSENCHLGDAGSHSIRYTYDQYNRLKTQTDVAGNTETYYYSDTPLATADNFPITSIVYQGANGQKHQLSFNYVGDNSINPLKAQDPTQVGKIAKITLDGDLTETYVYYQTTDNPHLSGKLKTLSISDHNGLQQAIEYKYDLETGFVIEKDYYYRDSDNNIVQNYTLDALGKILESRTTDAKGILTEDTLYTYDDANINILTKEDGLTKATIYYGYDKDNRLICERDSQGELRTCLSSPQSSQDYQYDINGELISDTIHHQTFAYDDEKQLVSFADNSKKITATYAYNANGMRSQKIINQQTIHYYYDNSQVPQLINEVLVTNTEKPQTASYLINGDQRYIRMYEDDNAQSHDQILLGDHKDINATLENDKLSVNYYDSYGIQLSDLSVLPVLTSNQDNILTLSYNPWGYASAYTDQESMLQYNRVRFYNPAIQRFIQRDEALAPMNKYAYALGNGVAYVDPTGNNAGLAFLSGFLNPIIGIAGGSLDTNMNWHWVDGASEYFKGVAHSSIGFVGNLAWGLGAGNNVGSFEYAVDRTMLVGSIKNSIQSGINGNTDNMAQSLGSLTTETAMILAGSYPGAEFGELSTASFKVKIRSLAYAKSIANNTVWTVLVGPLVFPLKEIAKGYIHSKATGIDFKYNNAYQDKSIWVKLDRWLFKRTNKYNIGTSSFKGTALRRLGNFGLSKATLADINEAIGDYQPQPSSSSASLTESSESKVESIKEISETQGMMDNDSNYSFLDQSYKGGNLSFSDIDNIE
ncbi:MULTISPECIES: RHS repeat domain-containing protein [Cysteiniphilum]|uniref:RHS repeat-associated core domain-containing protein n=1 Tax=Cysteiniphilum litorale TaxID=2056700 RepID=A0A8J2Z4N8_9GAMM|nr:MULTISPECIES: RHS repeat-associated core domain-containing protein [Cysteiniphilum]GGF98912.1 hypothetical protein GCM10010995_15200 [Cysteiniphilum litorale]